MPVEKCSIQPSLQLSRHRPVRRLTDSCDALLETGKRSRRKVAVILNRVPAVFDTADVGFVFTDVIRDGHCGARTCIASPFDETQRSVDNVRMPGRSGAPAREPNSLFEAIVPTDGIRAANMRDQGLRYVADFRAALGQAAACQ